MESKICKSCQSVKSVSEFWKHGGFKDGLHCNCKVCERDLMKHRSRKRAQKGLSTEVTEKKCSKCHTVKPAADFFRDASKKGGLASTCRECSLARSAAWISQNRERYEETSKAYSARKKAKTASYYTFWADTTQYDKAAADRAYRIANLDKVKRTVAAYIATPRGRSIKNESTRRSRLRHPEAMPAWADRDAILKFYADCPAGMHVDHIIPTGGRFVCGLHVLENLQYLPAQENFRKTNLFVVHHLPE
jgi:hypothetical protein